MKNILAQAAEKGSRPQPAVDAALLNDSAEKALHDKAFDIADRVTKLRAAREYIGALEAIATLRPQVDSLLRRRHGHGPRPAIRANRLALLARVLGDFSGIADFSEIVVTS